MCLGMETNKSYRISTAFGNKRFSQIIGRLYIDCKSLDHNSESMFDYNSARLTTRLRDKKSKHMVKSNSATVAQLDEGNLFLVIITYQLKSLMSILDAPSILNQSLKSEGEQTKLPAESNMLNVQIEDVNPNEYQEYFSIKLLLLNNYY